MDAAKRRAQEEAEQREALRRSLEQDERKANYLGFGIVGFVFLFAAIMIRRFWRKYGFGSNTETSGWATPDGSSSQSSSNGTSSSGSSSFSSSSSSSPSSSDSYSGGGGSSGGGGASDSW